MKLETRSTGRAGESIAKDYLERHGYKILEQNWRTRWAEIDLVALRPGSGQEGDMLVFVEVRSKVGEQFGTPEETLTKHKQWKMLQNAKAYVGYKKFAGPFRVDALCIVLGENSKPQRITHYENVIN